jgi:predicted DNA-binding transcriptional regulator YafY
MFESSIITAIQERRLLEMTYSGENRIIEPHTLGYLAGKHQLLAWQIRNLNDELIGEEWRIFTVSKITYLNMTTRHFPGKRTSPFNRHVRWDEIISSVHI